MSLRLAIDEPEAFERLVLRLRKLGVTRIDGLELGPEPRPGVVPAPREPRETDPLKARQKIHDTMFAATSVRPPLPEPEPSTNGVPRAVVQRRARNEGPRHGSETRSEG